MCQSANHVLSIEVCWWFVVSAYSCCLCPDGGDNTVIKVIN